jgi:chemotaxis protein MotB
MAGKGGGAWKVAYADFVTAMMAFFLVMWITAQNQEMKQAISSYFDDPYANPGATHPAANRGHGPSPHKRHAEHKQTGKYDERPVQLRLATHVESSRSTLGVRVPFAGDSIELTDDGKAALERLAPELIGLPQKIEIRGHATGAKLPPDHPLKDAWGLCYARCLATKAYLESLGIPAQRMRLSQGGSFEPITTEADAQRQAENARVDVFVLREYVEDTVGQRKSHGGQGEQGGAGHAADEEHPHEHKDDHGHGGQDQDHRAPAKDHGAAHANEHVSTRAAH